jgi:hypothetical protein
VRSPNPSTAAAAWPTCWRGSGRSTSDADPSDLEGIDCPPTCQAEYPQDDEIVTLTAMPGAGAIMAAVHAKEIAVEVTKCAGCGSIRVTWAGETQTFSLVGSPTRREQLVILPGPSDHSAGLVTVVVTSTDKKVEIDGIGARPALPGI